MTNSYGEESMKADATVQKEGRGDKSHPKNVEPGSTFLTSLPPLSMCEDSYTDNRQKLQRMKMWDMYPYINQRACLMPCAWRVMRDFPIFIRWRPLATIICICVF